MTIPRTTAPLICLLSSFLSLLIISHNQIYGQVAETERRYIRVGSLQSHFSAYGSERAWNNSYYEGLQWPAMYSYQDNAVIKRAWIASKDFNDAEGYDWGTYAVYFAQSYTGTSLFPMKLYQKAKFEPPTIYVNGIDLRAIYTGEIDSLDADLIPDRVVHNVVNTSMGLTMTRRIYAFSQQYHDNYFIKEYTFTNTGNTDWDDEIELNATLNDVLIGWGTRYSGGREGTWHVGGGQSWGQHSMVTRRGENYHEHYTEPITAANPIVDWLRCGFSWAGQNGVNGFNNIGAPDRSGDGRLTSPHHVGSVVLHVDKSVSDTSDDPNQPRFLGWHAGDTYPGVGDLQPSDENNMAAVWDMLNGTPYMDKGGEDRFDETVLGLPTENSYLKHATDPSTVHNDRGGTNVMITYGPFDIPPGESITIVEAEGISGLSREMCKIIGANWKNATTPFIFPDGSEVDDETEADIYKNAWVFTGKDSILLTFSRAKRNFDSGYQIPQPPFPPPLFDVTSGGDRIYLSWDPSPSESEADFGGYKIYRAMGRPDTLYDHIYTAAPSETVFEDLTPERGQSYYYYIVAYYKALYNTEGIANPTGELHSSGYYTRTTKAATLKRKAGRSLSDVRVVPNPYHKSASRLQYVGEADKIMFLDIPAYCRIKIFTERGDLVTEIEHTDGSGDEVWNSITSSRQVVVSGIYLAHIEVTDDYHDPVTGELLYKKGDSTIEKFVVIR